VKKIMQGKLLGKGRRGGTKPKTSWNKNLTVWTELTIGQLIQQTEEHLQWRGEMVYSVANLHQGLLRARQSNKLVGVIS